MSLAVKELKEFLRQQTWIDQLAEPLQSAVKGFYKSTGPVGEKLADFLHGTWLGHPLHPVITDVPIGSWIAAVVLDGMESSTGRRGFGRSADTAVTIGVVSAVGAAAAGLTDWQHLKDEPRRTGMLHALLNSLALVLFLGSLFSRKKKNRALGRSLALAGLTLSGAGAYLGGDLVFRQKIGVNHAPEQEQQRNYKAVASLDSLAEGRPTRAMLNDTPLVLVRRGQQVFALAESCAHLGGPLSEGELSSDDENVPQITCPWHGSTFAMDTGRIISGPSAYPQPCYDTRIRDGQVEVRPHTA
jgi:nitrite reductase/ring-hydroxylating ferredoxin subunit/uncharacterized membrane protein